MGEHGTWFDYLNRFGWFQSLSHNAESAMGRKWKFMMFEGSHFTLTHVMVTLLVVAFLFLARSSSKPACRVRTRGWCHRAK